MKFIYFKYFAVLRLSKNYLVGAEVFYTRHLNLKVYFYIEFKGTLNIVLYVGY
jgi:hypothetical protein